MTAVGAPPWGDEDTQQINIAVDSMKDVPSDQKDILKLRLRADAHARRLADSEKQMGSLIGSVRAVLFAVVGGSGGVIIAIVTAIWYMATFVAEVRSELGTLREQVTEIRSRDNRSSP